MEIIEAIEKLKESHALVCLENRALIKMEKDKGFANPQNKNLSHAGVDKTHGKAEFRADKRNRHLQRSACAPSHLLQALQGQIRPFDQHARNAQGLYFRG